MERGLFITVEGTDGSGKSTQLEFISDYLKENGETAIITREPGGTPIGEKIRAIILDKKNEEMSSVTEMLLYAASRAQHIDQLIGPALTRGRMVLCDRFIDSSLAYQGYARGLGDSVSVVNQYAIGDFMPDVTFLLKLHPRNSVARVKEQERDRMESQRMDFYQKVYDGYLDLEKKYPDRIVGIDGTGTIEEINQRIKTHLDRVLLSRKVRW